MSNEQGTVAQADRFDVLSPDGTSLAVWVEGAGPPIVLVHGSLSDHTGFDALVAEFRTTYTVFAMDRRAFGASSDAAAYAIEREFEDVAAVVDAVAARAGVPAVLCGHSYGANCAMGGATLTWGVRHLVLYEPSFGLAYPEGSIETVEAALAEGDLEAAIRLVLVDILGMDAADVDAMRATPRWEPLLAAAPTVPRECRAEEDWTYRPGQFDGITAQVLLLAGSESPPDLAETTRRAAGAMPAARVRTLHGHGHMAHRADPALVASIISEFVAK